MNNLSSAPEESDDILWKSGKSQKTETKPEEEVDVLCMDRKSFHFGPAKISGADLNDTGGDRIQQALPDI